MVDEFTRECLAIRVARKLKAADVIDVLSDRKRDRTAAYRFLVWLGIGVHLMSRWTPDGIERWEATCLAC